MKEKTIAVVGASRDRSKFGNKCVRAYLEAGYVVYPVNLTSSEIEKLPVYRTLSDLPRQPDRISVYLPPDKSHRLLPELARHSSSEVWFNPGAANRNTLEAARRLGIQYRDGCSIVDIGLSPSQFP